MNTEMSGHRRPKLGDVGALLRHTAKGDDDPLSGGDGSNSDCAEAANAQRQILADFCRLAGDRLRPANQAARSSASTSASSSPPTFPTLPTDLPPRVAQTLRCLLEGDSEKQVAAKLGLSRHTVHVYVKALHRRFDVSSRGELLAKWVSPSTVG